MEIWLVRKRMREVVLAKFMAGSGRTRRGEVANHVAQVMGAVINPVFHADLNRICSSLGGIKIKVEGKSHWKNIVYR